MGNFGVKDEIEQFRLGFKGWYCKLGFWDCVKNPYKRKYMVF